jgi:hypothetical protein
MTILCNVFTGSAFIMDEQTFSTYLDDIVGSGFVTLSISLGRSTGLFKTMCAMDSPATPAEIAERAQLKERYTSLMHMHLMYNV